MMLSRISFICAALAAMVTVACDTVPLTAPSGSALTISAGSSFVQPGGTTEITAFVVEQSGTAVQNGTTVHFSTNLGRVDPVDVQTKNGYATTTFIAGESSGVADVVASSGGTGGTVTPPPATGDNGAATPGTGTSTPGTQNSSSVRITIGAAATDNVILNASSTSVPLGGGTITLTAAVLDANGNRLRNVPVNFSTDAGTLSATVATTDSNGDAQVQLTTNRETTVTARVGAKSTTLRISVNAPSTISLTAVPPTLPSGGGSMTLTAVVLDVSGNRLANVPVNFTTTAGTLSQAVATTDANGEAQTTLTTTSATTVTARAGSATQTLSVGLGSGVQIATTSPASGTGPAASTTFVFTVTPGSGSVQSISIDFGDGSAPQSVSTSGPTPVSHSFSGAGAGTYTVRVTQTNTGGSTSTAFVVVNPT